MNPIRLAVACLLIASAGLRAQQNMNQPGPPTLEFVFELTAQVAAPDKIATTAGERRIVPITGGSFAGPDVKGKVLPGGADYQLIHADGFTEVEAHYVLETDRGERIYVNNKGMRHAPADVMAELNAGKAVDPSKIYFRTSPSFETESPRLQWLTRALFICVGERYPEGVKIRFYRVH
jgi:hypothetical protein